MTTTHRNPHSPSASTALPETLEQLMQQKAALLQEIREQKTLMVQTARDIVAPFTPATRQSNRFMRVFNRGMIVFDGIVLGMKMMRRFRNLFGRRR